MKILVETSARHIHLCQQDLNILFGKNFDLTVKRHLSQPGQYSCVERINISGPKGEIIGVSILGPVREYTQVEISLTDARKLGISPQIRSSGDLAGTPGCTLVGPAGTLELKNGVIVAKRHIHLDPKTADKFNLQDKQNVSVKINSPDRSLIFNDVTIRVNEKFASAMHIDTDEANAANIAPNGTFGNIIF